MQPGDAHLRVDVRVRSSVVKPSPKNVPVSLSEGAASKKQLEPLVRLTGKDLIEGGRMRPRVIIKINRGRQPYDANIRLDILGDVNQSILVKMPTNRLTNPVSSISRELAAIGIVQLARPKQSHRTGPDQVVEAVALDQSPAEPVRDDPADEIEIRLDQGVALLDRANRR